MGTHSCRFDWVRGGESLDSILHPAQSDTNVSLFGRIQQKVGNPVVVGRRFGAGKRSVCIGINPKHTSILSQLIGNQRPFHVLHHEVWCAHQCNMAQRPPKRALVQAGTVIITFAGGR
ncbi:hypothetical protein DX980_07820 [Burkholderia gladioli]|nr:hypothetical protein DX980_07820 [Burkholderia gladioli]